MRSIPAAVLAALLAVSASLVPAAPTFADGTGLPSSAKVVIVVGPVGSASDFYRSDAEAAAVVARQYSSNVITLYTPNATWAAVSQALQGASIVVYLGHGNGFPSPYTSSLIRNNYDGLGLNPVAGANDTTTQYFGEAYLASSIRLAPNAIVILSHLCYASGNSEPQNPPPTLDVAQQRVDNMAAGWLAAGARAVIAEGHDGPASYVGAAFTAHQSMDSLWQSAPTFHNNVFTFPSTRTPGALAEMDPDTTSGGYYRSMVWQPGLTSDQVVAGNSAPPASGGQVPLTIQAFNAPTSAFSPNGDGRNDTFSLTAQLSASAGWQVRFLDLAGRQLAVTSGSGPNVAATWDGTSFGQRVPDGQYRYELVASDPAGGPAVTFGGSLAVDTVAPVLSLTAAQAATPPAFSPNGDRHADTVSVGYRTSETGFVDAAITNAFGASVRSLSKPVAAGAGTLVWDGRDDGGAVVADGIYTVTLSARDRAGNVSTPLPVSVAEFSALSRVTSSTSVFFPQDGDAYSKTASLSYTLSGPATVDWNVVDAAGNVVRTLATNQSTAPGTYTFSWDGRDAGGAFVPRGTYYSTVRATSGPLTITDRAAVVADAFRILPNTASPARGAVITVTVVTAEALQAAPRLTIRQPGFAAATVTLVRLSGSTYRIGYRLRTGGPSGAVVLTVAGVDLAGGSNASALTLSLR